MKIAVIGAGFAGLSAAYEALKNGHEVIIFERDGFLGGLAAGMRGRIADYPAEWEWDLEQFYHHWFTNDHSVFNLARELNVAHKIIIERPVSSILYNDTAYPFDSPISLLSFPHFGPIEKLRVSFLLASLKYLNTEKSSKRLEHITAHEYLLKAIGKRPYQILFEPLLKGKFGEHYKEINMRWFWARIFKRTPTLAYYEGGFSAFAQDIAHAITIMGGEIRLNTPVNEIKPLSDGRFQVLTEEPGLDNVFDKVIVTTPPFTLSKMVHNLPTNYSEQLKGQKGIGAYVLILSSNRPLLDKTYWLNINANEWPMLAIVEHTNFIDKVHYNNEHVVYIGNYVDATHPHMQMSKEQLLNEFAPFLKKVNPNFTMANIVRTFLLKTPYAQPIVGLNHDQKLLSLETPIPNLYLATMAQVYPWDRGTNYAIEIGARCARVALASANTK